MMRWNRFLLLLSIATIAFGGELTGTWTGTFMELAPDDSVQRTGTAYMDLRLTGQTVSGTAGETESNQFPITRAKLEGTKLTFDIDRAQGTMKFDLTFDGESIKGRVSADRGAQRLVAKVDLKRKAARANDRAAHEKLLPGERATNTRRVTEVFVNHNGAWVNPSRHMDGGK